MFLLPDQNIWTTMTRIEESVTSHTNHIHRNTRNHALTIVKLLMGYASAEVSTKVAHHKVACQQQVPKVAILGFQETTIPPANNSLKLRFMFERCWPKKLSFERVNSHRCLLNRKLSPSLKEMQQQCNQRSLDLLACNLEFCCRRRTLNLWSDEGYWNPGRLLFALLGWRGGMKRKERRKSHPNRPIVACNPCGGWIFGNFRRLHGTCRRQLFTG